MKRRDDGQATVEFALVLPLVTLLLLVGMQLVLIGRNQVLVVHSARAASRVAASSHDVGKVESAGRNSVPGLEGDRLTFEIERRDDGLVAVVARYRQQVLVPGLPRELELTGRVAMPAEIP